MKELMEKYDWFFCTPTTGKQKIVDAVILQLGMLLSSKDAGLGLGVAPCRMAEIFLDLCCGIKTWWCASKESHLAEGFVVQNPDDGHMVELCSDVAVLVAETNLLVEQEVSLLASFRKSCLFPGMRVTECNCDDTGEKHSVA